MSISGRHAKGWSSVRISTEMEEEAVEIQTRRSEGWVEFLKLCYFTWKTRRTINQLVSLNLESGCKDTVLLFIFFSVVENRKLGQIQQILFTT